ncbi:MAG: septum formation protein [Candidatus Omnitrophota bacterium]|jgi:septum formation protein
MIYLASQSPRRRDLLKSAGISFKVVKSVYREKRRPSVTGPIRVARLHARGKALGAKITAKKGIVLGSDTLIAFRREVIGKPRNRNEAKLFLDRFSNSIHHVITAVYLLDIETEKGLCFHVKSEVHFKKLSAEIIHSYLDCGEYKDKAGAYGFQSKGKSLVRKVIGSKTNVIGLPTKELKHYLNVIVNGSR